MKILVVEDDRVVAEALRVILSDRMYAVEVAHDGQAGLDFIEAFDYDLLLLDAILPKLDGISICRHVRSRGYLMPILLLTSKDSRHDRAIGLDAGADDYVVKPFDPEELSARIRALLRRGNDRAQPVLTWEDLTLNPCNYEVTYQHQLLSLTPKEYALLELFLRHSRQLFSCGAILEHLWTYEDTPSEEAVRTHIKGLRHKLKAAGAPTDFVETVYGIGYRLRLGDPATDLSQERLRQGEPSLGDRQIGVVPVASAAPLEPLLVPSAVMVSEGARFLYRETTSTLRQTEWIDPLGTSPPTIEDTTTSVSQTADADLLPSGCATAQQSPPGDPDCCGSPSQRLRHRQQHWAGEPPEVATSNSLHFLTEIWNQHHEQMLDRVASIDRAIVALQDRYLDPEIRNQAWHSAHTLAGALGTFGLPLGSQVAKQIELLLEKNTELTSAQIPQLQSDVDRLRREIASKIPGTEPEIVTPPPKNQSPWLLAIVSELDLVTALKSAHPNRFEIVSATELVPAQLEQTPDSIVLDLDCFPQIADGLTALSELDRDYPNIPVLVLSQPSPSTDAESPDRGTGRLRQRIEVARRGGRLFLSKPLPASEILLAVDRVLQQAHASQPKVTIVDDDRLLLEGVRALLSRQGMTVTTLSEPSRFWETLEASTPDLLILDLDMPMHDGIELCRAVRTDPNWATLPILFLTAHTASIASDQVFAAGADDFVTKPVVDATLVTRIVNRLDRIGIHRSN